MSINAILKYGQGKFAQCAPGDTLHSAAQKMVAADVNGLAVIDNAGKLVGVVTGHDIIQAIVNRNHDVTKVFVYEQMSEKVVTCTPKMRLTEALHMMSERGVQHLVVIDSSTPVAVLSIKDVLSRMHQNDELEINVLKDVVVAARVH